MIDRKLEFISLAVVVCQVENRPGARTRISSVPPV